MAATTTKHDLIPPILYPLIRRIVSHGTVARLRARLRTPARDAFVRPCHYTGLFLKYNGDVFPCCLVRDQPHMVIGNLDDPNLSEKIRSFGPPCSCEQFVLRHARRDELPCYQDFNIEFALTCQGHCAMCCVGSPGWKGTYYHYDALTALFERFGPATLSVQGGEVLVQDRSLAWLCSAKQRRPNVRIGLITNGNVPLHQLEQVEALFHDVWISVVGFQPGTYRAIMGLDFGRMQSFAEALIRGGKVKVTLKYLVTASNVHEAGLFLQWAIELGPTQCAFQTSGLDAYVNPHAPNDYWRHIYRFAATHVKDVIERHKTDIGAKGIKILFDTECRRLFEVDDSFVQRHATIIAHMKNFT